MEHHLLHVHEADKHAAATEIAARDGRVIMFLDTKHAVDRMARHLLSVGVRASALHGGKSQPQRNRTLAQFKDGHVTVLVATNVAARGIHVAGLDLVVNVDPPGDHKDYLHRGGRTARAGESGTVVTLVLPHQRRAMDRLMADADITAHTVRVRPGEPELRRITGARTPSGVPVTVTAPAEPRPETAGRRSQGGASAGRRGENKGSAARRREGDGSTGRRRDGGDASGGRRRDGDASGGRRPEGTGSVGRQRDGDGSAGRGRRGRAGGRGEADGPLPGSGGPPRRTPRSRGHARPPGGRDPSGRRTGRRRPRDGTAARDAPATARRQVMPAARVGPPETWHPARERAGHASRAPAGRAVRHGAARRAWAGTARLTRLPPPGCPAATGG
ncbi:hypothetical protein GCM10020295_39810 [Streptomyces cinereospinus]